MEMDAQPRPLFIGPLAALLALAVLSPRASVSDDQTPADAPAANTPGETAVPQKLVDIISFRGNVRKLQAASADFKRISGSDDIEAGWVFEALSGLDDIDFLTPDSPANFRCDVLLTTPAFDFATLTSPPVARDKLRIEVVLDTDPHSLLLTARLQRDVALTGSRAVDTATELIAKLLDL